MSKKKAIKKMDQDPSKLFISNRAYEKPPANEEEIFVIDMDGNIISHQVINHNQCNNRDRDIPPFIG